MLCIFWYAFAHILISFIFMFIFICFSILLFDICTLICVILIRFNLSFFMICLFCGLFGWFSVLKLVGEAEKHIFFKVKCPFCENCVTFQLKVMLIWETHCIKNKGDVRFFNLFCKKTKILDEKCFLHDVDVVAFRATHFTPLHSSLNWKAESKQINARFSYMRLLMWSEVFIS